jgi:hypothetical protein
MCDDILNWCNMFDIIKNIELKEKSVSLCNVAEIIPTLFKMKSYYKRLRDGYQLYWLLKCKYLVNSQNKWLESWKMVIVTNM